MDVLKDKIAKAKEIKQGNKSIAAAEKVTDEAAVIDVLTALNKAIDDFNNSADKTSSETK